MGKYIAGTESKMKAKESKYVEACERNVHSAEGPKRRKYAGKPFDDVKRILGIRQDDMTYDARLYKITQTMQYDENSLYRLLAADDQKR